ncbi:autotransporter outer membrane beta-barrel domain-containing protein [Phascolarctobacterium sp.]
MIKTSKRCEKDVGIRSFENRRGDQNQKDTEKNYSIRFGKTEELSETYGTFIEPQAQVHFGGICAAITTPVSNGVEVSQSGIKSTVAVSVSFNDTWFEYGICAALATGSNSQLYFDVERNSGSDFKKDWQWNVGARWTF